MEEKLFPQEKLSPLAHLLLKFRKRKQKSSWEAEKLGNQEGNALFSHLNLNPTKLTMCKPCVCMPFTYGLGGVGGGGDTN